MKVTKVIYQAPGVRDYITREFPNPSSINMQQTYLEIIYGGGFQFLVPASSVVQVESYVKEEENSDDNGKPESEGEETPAASTKPATKSKS